MTPAGQSCAPRSRPNWPASSPTEPRKSSKLRPGGIRSRTTGPRGFRHVGLQTYLTAGPKEARAWTISRGHRADGGRSDPHGLRTGIHQGRVIAFDDLVAAGSVAASERGEGPDGRQGLCDARRRCRGVPLQHMKPGKRLVNAEQKRRLSRRRREPVSTPLRLGPATD